eukprot:1193351-Prorocentrum_minimum.AAC.2
MEGASLRGRKAKKRTLKIRRKRVCEILRISTDEVSAMRFSLDLREHSISVNLGLNNMSLGSASSLHLTCARLQWRRRARC